MFITSVTPAAGAAKRVAPGARRIRSPQEAAFIPWRASELSLYFSIMNPLRVFGEAVAESRLCAVESDDSMLNFVPPMRQHSPPESRCKKKFSFF
jgi:hypothetical protein